MEKRFRILFPLLAALLSLSLGALLGELVLRVFWERPPVPRHDAEPSYRPHPKLGWTHVPGAHLVGGATATFLEDSSRATSAGRHASTEGAVLLVGGSYTEGYGVEDDESFGWLLQDRFPERAVLNFGTGGYGTLQALYTMEEHLPRLCGAGGASVAVVYGYIWHHPMRNVAHHRWRRSLSARRGGQSDPVRIPYALLDDEGRLRRFPPTAWPSNRLTARASLAGFLTEQWIAWTTNDRSEQARPVTCAILDEMNRLAIGYGASFRVAVLQDGGDSWQLLRACLTELGVPYVYCFPPDYQAKYRDPETRHPNPLAHRYFADCIGNVLESAS